LEIGDRVEVAVVTRKRMGVRDGQFTITPLAFDRVPGTVVFQGGTDDDQLVVLVKTQRYGVLTCTAKGVESAP
jgi:hypothetical protein